MLEMGRAYLSVDETWIQYLTQSQNAFNDHNDKILADLERLAEETWPKVPLCFV